MSIMTGQQVFLMAIKVEALCSSCEFHNQLMQGGYKLADHLEGL